LLLPSLGPASTRAQMWPLARQLQDDFETFTVDWPGFGAGPHPRFAWQPAHYRAFLVDLCAELFDGPIRVAAAGHASTYALQVAAEHPATWSRIAMIAPTWRCPLSTTLGTHRWLWAGLRRFVGLPGIGETLYRLTVAAPVLNRLYQTHLFGDATKVTPRLIEEKGRVCRQPNARYAATAFITGALDPVPNATDYEELIGRQLVPILAVCGLETPPRPWREMAILLKRPEVTVNRIPGALAPHEEHPAPVSRMLEEFFT
ncbi:MAG: alpha/beta hydrolase, partial [Gemmatimonadetes bacterium]|nr:alpha/beta hydrolase [Gemmatimonadota bacterium]